MNNTASAKKEVTESYIEEIYREKIEPKINKKAIQGKSELMHSTFWSYTNVKAIAKYLERLGYEVKIGNSVWFFGYALIIKW
ncbi:hypothetical protein ACEUW3_07650 [Staphylococcus pseudintermedius]|uniref:Uncharacterized protein n=2 Tax=Staphylococcus intermedius group TaxID=2815305 RepID=A0A2A4GV68_9STAP|nr:MULTISPECIES: hypothetical protein [Staphylococcus intermedius group]PCF54142.1 hypothetical protein B5C08_11350 [Staphylococcus delphini]PCF70721.1 hypothetical protein B4W72_12045 [Staphylococcus delphini]PCF87414.1 hypothetical protein B4W76_03220 [Staphylococcus intermedius]PNZ52248.1 hypothetical protein CD138_06995 [Staphylococcus intermedius NCTC 11048]SUM47077.1 Uncharacterised protein [Staphylococcus intermedius NCTC 11048]